MASDYQINYCHRDHHLRIGIEGNKVVNAFRNLKNTGGGGNDDPLSGMMMIVMFFLLSFILSRK
jgi:hypothetical protein